MIDDGDVHWLESVIDEEEFLEVIKSLNGDKAPGLDGFLIAFFQCCEDVVKADMMGNFHSFHDASLFE